MKIAFDGDAVIFSDDSEKSISMKRALDAFIENEREGKSTALKEGPFKSFLVALNKTSKLILTVNDCPIRTALGNCQVCSIRQKSNYRH